MKLPEKTVDVARRQESSRSRQSHETFRALVAKAVESCCFETVPEPRNEVTMNEDLVGTLFRNGKRCVASMSSLRGTRTEQTSSQRVVAETSRLTDSITRDDTSTERKGNTEKVLFILARGREDAKHATQTDSSNRSTTFHPLCQAREEARHLLALLEKK